MAFDTKASGRNGFGVGDHSPTLRAMNGKRLNGGGQIGVFQQNSRSEVRFIDGDGQITGSVTSEPGAQQQNYLAGHGVRRLTPRECERLQGFPDDWTLIPWRGKMAPDGPRYKAIGNSMAVPVMRWIGERIATIEAIL
jgi:DNA (cytosine-5)-methyltransferase 1